MHHPMQIVVLVLFPTPNKSLASESQYQLLLIISSSFIDVYTPGCLLIEPTVYIFFFSDFDVH